MSTYYRILRGTLFLLTFLSLAHMALLAQGTGEVTGRVVDSSGAVIPGAEVTLTNLGTDEARTVISSDDGVFRIASLGVGDYSIEASLTGFKRAQGEVTVTVGQTVNAVLTLEVGDIAETIEVTDVATAVNVEQGRVSSLVDKKRIEELPLNGRNVYQLMQLAPGAVNTESTVFEPGQNTNVNGGRANMNGFWMDGVTTKGLSGGTGAGDTAGVTPNLEAVQEFRIETLNFSAEYGNSVGSIVSVVSKTGTNEFHGSVFEFLRNDNLDAREFFDGPEGPEFKQNQFGAAVGGPIVKDRTFFFASYEGTRIRTGQSSIGTFESSEWNSYMSSYGAPTAAFLFGTYKAPNITSVTNTVGEYLVDFGYIGAPDQASVDAFLGETYGSPAGALSAGAPMQGETSFFSPDSTDNDGFSVRIDQELTDSHKLFGKYFFNNSNGGVVEARTAFNSEVKSRAHLGSIALTSVFSPTIVNEARVGFTRNIGDIFPGDPGVPQMVDGGSGTQGRGAAIFGAYNGYPQIFHENIFTYADTLSITSGNHGLKIGAEVRRNQENSEFNVGRPSYYFFDLVAIGLDDPYYQIGGVDPHINDGTNLGELASNFRGWRNWEVGLFVNDDWKLKPNLTVNLGLRWDYYSRLKDVQDRTTRFNFDNGSDYAERVRNGFFEGPVDQLSSNDYNNFAPRLGLAWDPFSDGKMSIRAGYGIAFQSGVYNPLANSRWNKPFYSFNLICDVCGREGETILFGPQDGSAPRPDGANPNPGAGQFEGNIIAYDPTNPNLAFLSGIANPDMRDPYTQSMFVGLQREMWGGLTFEANYVATLGRKLIRAENPNRFVGDRIGLGSPVNNEFAGDTAFNRINPNEGTLRVWENNVNSSYHALQVQLNKRYSSGFALNTNYTWSKSLDVRSTWHSGATSSNRGQEGYSTDISNVGLDYGRSVFDARHRFVVNWLYDTPWAKNADNWLVRNIIGNWQINGILALQTGQPYTPHCSSSFPGGCDFNADGNNNDRPNTPASGNSLDSDRLDFVRPGGAFGISGSTATKLAFFGVPTAPENGTLGRNTFEGPGFRNFDFSLFKELSVPQLGEQGKVQLRFEFFNMTNHANFFQPQVRINTSTFGRSTQSFDARQVQIGIKILF